MCINEFIYLSVYGHIMPRGIAMFPDAFGQVLARHHNARNSTGDGVPGCHRITDLVPASQFGARKKRVWKYSKTGTDLIVQKKLNLYQT